MFDHKKSAAITWLVGGFTLACVGVGHAVAAAPTTTCSYDAQGNKTCVSKSDSTYTSPDGRYQLHQQQDCTTVSRPVAQSPQFSIGQQGTTRIGAAVGCSNNAPAPAGFKAPDFSR